jgi:hypothetical protein
VLIPLSFAGFVAVAVQQFYEWPLWTLTVMSLAIGAVPIAVQLRYQRKPVIELARHYKEIAVVHEAQPRPVRTPEPALKPATEGAEA